MNIFASDLDQTLIYSHRWIKDTKKEFIAIEKKEDKVISYILSDTLKEIKSIITNNYFIPITTRTLSQYRRINLDDLFTPYAVVANGGIILINDEIDLEWEKVVKNNLAKCTSYETMLKKASFLENEKGFIKFGSADNLFFYMIAEEDIFNKNVLNLIKGDFKKNNWRIFDQGRKVYFIPNAITKGRALKYLKEKLNSTFVVSSGDSLLDISLSEHSDLFMIPNHSALDYKNKMNSVGIDNGFDLAKNAKIFLEEKHKKSNR
ncbi:HAD family hydrolase [Helicovermis profundi]|uniref:HAD hydrolase family protein n=1 Tax=Helicovermis profundi TaxID=3065157 RepID=A0AAU9E325_9FIRM|nr:HAD hydrolase family protein [Clostridia bacterium S502]